MKVFFFGVSLGLTLLMLLTQILPPGTQTTISYKVQLKVEKLESGIVSRPRYPIPPVQIISLSETQASENA